MEFKGVTTNNEQMSVIPEHMIDFSLQGEIKKNNNLKFKNYLRAVFETYIYCDNPSSDLSKMILAKFKQKLHIIDKIHLYILDEDVDSINDSLTKINPHRIAIYIYFAIFMSKPQSVQAFMDHIYVQSYRAMEAMCRKDVRLNSQSYMLFRIKKDFLRVVNILGSQYLKAPPSQESIQCFLCSMSISDSIFREMSETKRRENISDYLAALNEVLLDNNGIALRLGHYISEYLIPMKLMSTIFYLYQVFNLPGWQYVRWKCPKFLDFSVTTFTAMTVGHRYTLVNMYINVIEQKLDVAFIQEEIEFMIKNLHIDNLRKCVDTISLLLPNCYLTNGDQRIINLFIIRIFSMLCQTNINKLEQWKVLNELILLLVKYSVPCYQFHDNMVIMYEEMICLNLNTLIGLDEISSALFCLSNHHIQGYMKFDLCELFNVLAIAGFDFDRTYTFVPYISIPTGAGLTSLSCYFYIIFNRMGGNISYSRWFEHKNFSILVECFKSKMNHRRFIRACQEILTLAKMFLLDDLEFYYDKLVEYINKQLKTSIAQTSTLYGLCQEVVLLKVAKCDLDKCKEFELPQIIKFDIDMYYKPKHLLV